MTKAYICDKCGVILPPNGNVRKIYTVNPALFSEPPEHHEIDLCKECYRKFESEYVENLMEEGGDD